MGGMGLEAPQKPALKPSLCLLWSGKCNLLEFGVSFYQITFSFNHSDQTAMKRANKYSNQSSSSKTVRTLHFMCLGLIRFSQNRLKSGCSITLAFNSDVEKLKYINDLNA